MWVLNGTQPPTCPTVVLSLYSIYIVFYLHIRDPVGPPNSKSSDKNVKIHGGNIFEDSSFTGIGKGMYQLQIYTAEPVKTGRKIIIN